jgi:hypothetical protein
MKTLAFIVLAISLFSLTINSHAGEVRGYFRSNGTYVQPHYRSSSGYSSGQVHHYRNPYAANPVVRVQSYQKSDGTHVIEHYRTPANSILTDNLSYRGFGTVRSSTK